MPGKISKKELRRSDREQERKIFRAILRKETSVRGLVLHGQKGTGKTILLKMFEDDCETLALPHPTVLYFTANRPLNWQKILDDTVNKLGPLQFPTYTRLRQAYASRSKAVEKVPVPTIYIENVQGVVHTGTGDIINAPVSASASERPSAPRSAEIPQSRENIRDSLTRTFLQELNNLSESLQLVWLVDTTEKLDNGTREWLKELFYQIDEDGIDRLVLVVAGQEELCYEPYWKKIKKIRVGDFDEETVQKILWKAWPDNDPDLLITTAELFIENKGGKPGDLIPYMEGYIFKEEAV